VPAFDEPCSPPNSLSLRLSANLQRVLRHEAAFDKVIDPAAGAYFVEHLTDALAHEAWTHFQQIEAQGGYLKFLSAGTAATLLGEWAKTRKAAIDKGKITVLGVNQYPDLSQRFAPLTASPRTAPTKYFAELKQALGGPPAYHVDAVLEHLPRCTIAEILEQYTMELHAPATPDQPQRDSEAFESLRLAIQAAPRPPRVHLLRFGDPALRQARAQFAGNLLACAGILPGQATLADDLDAAVHLVSESQADLVVLCAGDADYLALGPVVGSRLQAALPKAKICIAGRLAGWEALHAHGISDCIYLGMDRLAWLQTHFAPTAAETEKGVHHAS
jgi:methylmalonyl-CoA mutase